MGLILKAQMQIYNWDFNCQNIQVKAFRSEDILLAFSDKPLFFFYLPPQTPFPPLRFLPQICLRLSWVESIYTLSTQVALLTIVFLIYFFYIYVPRTSFLKSKRFFFNTQNQVKGCQLVCLYTLAKSHCQGQRPLYPTLQKYWVLQEADILCYPMRHLVGSLHKTLFKIESVKENTKNTLCNFAYSITVLHLFREETKALKQIVMFLGKRTDTRSEKQFNMPRSVSNKHETPLLGWAGAQRL